MYIQEGLFGEHPQGIAPDRRAVSGKH